MSDLQLEMHDAIGKPLQTHIGAISTSAGSRPRNSRRTDVQRASSPREEIISLLRGQLACPVISCLEELGWLEHMLEAPFDHTTFPGAPDEAAFHSVMRYLTALQLLEFGQGLYRVTALGTTVFRRSGAFCILHSYEAYTRQLRTLLLPDGTRRPEVSRRRNVLGSGVMHGRKFFKPALELLGNEQVDVIADVGCGDGEFLARCATSFPGAHLVGIDLSEVAVNVTRTRFQKAGQDTRFSGLIANGADIHAWVGPALALAKHGRLLISMWFLLHEFSENRVHVVATFLRRLQHACPNAIVIIGEVVKHSAETLRLNRGSSVLPELTLVHELSGQGLLTWDQWQEVVARVPYQIERQLLFDELVPSDGGELMPSNFIWKLVPRQSS